MESRETVLRDDAYIQFLVMASGGNLPLSQAYIFDGESPQTECKVALGAATKTTSVFRGDLSP